MGRSGKIDTTLAVIGSDTGAEAIFRRINQAEQQCAVSADGLAKSAATADSQFQKLVPDAAALAKNLSAASLAQGALNKAWSAASSAGASASGAWSSAVAGYGQATVAAYGLMKAVDIVTDGVTRGSRSMAQALRLEALPGGTDQLEALMRGLGGVADEAIGRKATLSLRKFNLELSQTEQIGQWVQYRFAMFGNDVPSLMDKVKDAFATGEFTSLKTMGINATTVTEAIRQMGEQAQSASAQVDTSLVVAVEKLKNQWHDLRDTVYQGFTIAATSIFHPDFVSDLYDATVRANMAAQGWSQTIVDLNENVRLAREDVEDLNHAFVQEVELRRLVKAELALTQYQVDLQLRRDLTKAQAEFNKEEAFWFHALTQNNQTLRDGEPLHNRYLQWFLETKAAVSEAVPVLRDLGDQLERQAAIQRMAERDRLRELFPEVTPEEEERLRRELGVAEKKGGKPKAAKPQGSKPRGDAADWLESLSSEPSYTGVGELWGRAGQAGQVAAAEQEAERLSKVANRMDAIKARALKDQKDLQSSLSASARSWRMLGSEMRNFTGTFARDAQAIDAAVGVLLDSWSTDKIGGALQASSVLTQELCEDQKTRAGVMSGIAFAQALYAAVEQQWGKAAGYTAAGIQFAVVAGTSGGGSSSATAYPTGGGGGSSWGGSAGGGGSYGPSRSETRHPPIIMYFGDSAPAPSTQRQLRAHAERIWAAADQAAVDGRVLSGRMVRRSAKTLGAGL